MFTTSDTNEENYLASVSDIMSGLIFIFIITLMVFSLQLKGSQEDQERENQKLREKIAEYEILQKNLKAEVLKYKEILEILTNARGLRVALLASIQKSLESKGFNVKIDSDHGVLSLPEQVLFPSGSNQLQKNGREMLTLLADVLYTNLQACTFTASGTSIFSKTNLPAGIEPSYIEAIFIEGHTDNVPIGKGSIFRDNWDLSTSRSLTTFKALIDSQPGLNKLFNESGYPIFSVSGYAELRPVASNETVEGRSLNRRIDIRVIMSPPKSSENQTQILINGLENVK